MLQQSSETLRCRLQQMTERLMSLEEIVTIEAERKRNAAEEEIQIIASDVNRIEQTLTGEIKERVTRGRMIDSAGKELIKSATEYLGHKLEEHFSKTADRVEELLNCIVQLEQRSAQLTSIAKDDKTNQKGSDESCEENERETKFDSFEKGVHFVHSEIARIQRNLEAVRTEAEFLENELGLNYLSSIDDEHRKAIQKIRDVKRKLNTGLNDGLPEFQKSLDNIREEVDKYRKEIEDSTETYKLYIPEEMKAFQYAIKSESEIREETDDEVVAALNNYNKALQRRVLTIVNND